MTDLQQIFVFENPGKKLAHVGIYNMETKQGLPNYAAKLDAQYQAAKTNKLKDLSIDSIGAEKAFCSSFMARLMNTDRAEWIVRYHAENLAMTEAKRKAEDIIAAIETRGYSVTGRPGTKKARHDGPGGKNASIRINPENTTQAKLYAILEKLFEGNTALNKVKVKRDLAKLFFGLSNSGFNTRRAFWHHVNDNMDLYGI